jgi:hypothetical protein
MFTAIIGLIFASLAAGSRIQDEFSVRIKNVQVASYLYDHRSLRGRKTLSNPPAGVPAITLYTHDPNGHLFQEIAGSGPNIGQALVTYRAIA